MTEREQRYRMCAELRRAAVGLRATHPEVAGKIEAILPTLTDRVVRVTFDLPAWTKADRGEEAVRSVVYGTVYGSSVVADSRVGTHVFSCLVEGSDGAIEVRDRLASAMRRSGSDPSARRLAVEEI